MAEVFGEDYLVPTLMGYVDLKRLLDPELEKSIAHTVCVAALSPFKDDDWTLKALLDRLRERGASSLATTIEATCERLRDEL